MGGHRYTKGSKYEFEKLQKRLIIFKSPVCKRIYKYRSCDGCIGLIAHEHFPNLIQNISGCQTVSFFPFSASTNTCQRRLYTNPCARKNQRPYHRICDRRRGQSSIYIAKNSDRAETGAKRPHFVVGDLEKGIKSV